MFSVLFFGPDGSGKTTLARLLKWKLEKEGKRTKISWMRGTHTLTLVIASFMSRFSTFKGNDNPYFNIRITGSKSLWQLLEFVSALPIILFKYKLPELLGFLVIGERSYVDLVVWITVTSRDPSFLKSKFASFLLRLAMKGKNFFITADRTTLMERRKEVSKDCLLRQLAYYEVLSQVLGAHRINTSHRSPYRLLMELSVGLK